MQFSPLFGARHVTPGTPVTPHYSPITPTPHSMDEDPAIIEAGPPAGAMEAVGARIDILPMLHLEHEARFAVIAALHGPDAESCSGSISLDVPVSLAHFGVRRSSPPPSGSGLGHGSRQYATSSKRPGIHGGSGCHRSHSQERRSGSSKPPAGHGH